MSRDLRIQRLTVRQYQWTMPDLGVDYNGFNQVYEPGSSAKQGGYVLTIETDAGITGEYAGGNGAVLRAARYGRAVPDRQRRRWQRELIWNDIKRALRKHDRFGMAPSTSRCGTSPASCTTRPIYELLGGCRTTLPAYASTYHGDENGGLTSPRPSPTSRCSARRWATRRSRSTAGATARSSARSPTCWRRARRSATAWT